MTKHDPQPRLWMRLSQHVLDARGRAVPCLSFNEFQARAGRVRYHFDVPAFKRSARGRVRTTPILLKHILDAHFCPHCAYDLIGQTAGSDSPLVTCPECACVWRIGDAD